MLFKEYKLETVFYLCLMFILNSCNKPEIKPDALPENQVAIDSISGMEAKYILPTSKYDHGILGDEIEAGGLMLNYKNRTHILELDSNLVFEDIQPRLFDFDLDGSPEIITILTHINLGASVAIYQLKNASITKYAQSAYIGRSHRWLNIAEIGDFDQNGQFEIIWVSTPHIGGVLKVGRIINDEITVLDSISGVSNHKIGSGNLDLSIVSIVDGSTRIYVPSNDFHSIIGFVWNEPHLSPIDTIKMDVDYSIPLKLQLN